MTTDMEAIKTRMLELLECYQDESSVDGPAEGRPDTQHVEQHVERFDDRAIYDPWALAEWRRVSIPQWRETLAEAERAGDVHRTEYARWMLAEVLLDELSA